MVLELVDESPHIWGRATETIESTQSILLDCARQLLIAIAQPLHQDVEGVRLLHIVHGHAIRCQDL
jgi:hypothetical protein